jgi:hypothetical protein
VKRTLVILQTVVIVQLCNFLTIAVTSTLLGPEPNNTIFFCDVTSPVLVVTTNAINENVKINCL